MNNRVLVIDDSPFIYKAVKRALEPYGYEIVGHAENGMDGLRLIEELSPDVVTLDVTMPVLDGLGVAAKLGHKRTSNTILLSAMGDGDLLRQAQGLGIKHFLAKPFQPDELLSLVKICQGSN